MLSEHATGPPIASHRTKLLPSTPSSSYENMLFDVSGSDSTGKERTIKVQTQRSKCDRIKDGVTFTDQAVGFVYRCGAIAMMVLIFTKVQDIDTTLTNSAKITTRVMEPTGVLDSAEISMTNVAYMSTNMTHFMDLNTPYLNQLIYLTNVMLEGLPPDTPVILANQANQIMHAVVAGNVTRVLEVITGILVDGKQMSDEFKQTKQITIGFGKQ